MCLTEHIVLNSLNAVIFYKRNMFVNYCIDTNIRSIFPEDSIESSFICDAHNLHINIQCSFVCKLQTLLDVICPVLIYIKNYKLFQFHLGKLPTKFRFDASTSSGDENHFTFVVCFGPIIQNFFLCSENSNSHNYL